MAKMTQINGTHCSLRIQRDHVGWCVIDTVSDMIVAVCATNEDALKRAIHLAMNGGV